MHLFYLCIILISLASVASFRPFSQLPVLKQHQQLQHKHESGLFKKNSNQIGFRRTRLQPLKDLLGLGVPEIALIVVAALVLFGPETLKSLSRDVGKAAAELKEIPKTFKEGMEEGQQEAQISKLKALAAEKRKRRAEKEKNEGKDDDEDDDFEVEEVKTKIDESESK